MKPEKHWLSTTLQLAAPENVANYIATAADGDLFELEPAEPCSDADLNWADDNSRVVREHDNPDERDVALVKSTSDNWNGIRHGFLSAIRLVGHCCLAR